MSDSWEPADQYPTDPARPWWRTTPAAVTAAVAAVLLAGVAGLLVGGVRPGGSDASEPLTASTGELPSVQAEASATAALNTPGPVESTPAASPASLPVYFVKDDGFGPRLYREFHRVTTSSGLVEAALVEMTKPALDPDYRSAWAGSQVQGYSQEGGTATVRLTHPTAGLPEGADLDMAVQEVVYTVTGVEQDAALKVRLEVDGKPLAAAPVVRAERSTTEGLVWLTSPTEGATVSGKVRLEGVASVFEATVAWEVLAGSKVVRHGTATASAAGPTRATWRTSVTLAPGTYTIRAYAPDESSTTGEGVVAEDTKTVTVS